MPSRADLCPCEGKLRPRLPAVHSGDECLLPLDLAASAPDALSEESVEGCHSSSLVHVRRPSTAATAHSPPERHHLNPRVPRGEGPIEAGHTWKYDPKTGKAAIIRSPSGMSKGLK